MAKQKRRQQQQSRAPEVAPSPPPPQDADAISAAIRTLLTAMADGRLVIGPDGDGHGSRDNGAAPGHALTVQEPLARRRLSPEPAPSSPELQLYRALQMHTRISKHQRKPRQMPARKRYSAASLTKADLQAIIMGSLFSTLSPAARELMSYLIAHPRSSVKDLCASLDRPQKTVENLLSILRKAQLLKTESV